MNILETIIAQKKKEVDKRKAEKSIEELKNMPFYLRKTFSLKDFLLREDKTGIIAEFKRQSPSKGIINNCQPAGQAGSFIANVTRDYVKYGASAVSVLTDEEFFGGSLSDLLDACVNEVPLLRKDFIIDEYQLIESKTYGADVILLIAACLTKDEVKKLSVSAKKMGLNVLLEIHDESELAHICDEIDVVGINNRNLKTFKVDINHSIELCKKIPAPIIKISESGLNDAETISYLRKNGFNGFLIGEKFMSEKNPGLAFGNFVDQLKKVS